MKRSVLTGLSVVGVVGVCAAAAAFWPSASPDYRVTGPGSPEGAPRPVTVQALPRSDERVMQHVVDRSAIQVLQWLFRHRPDLAALDLVTLEPAVAVTDNPFTGEPATRMRVHLQSTDMEQARTQRPLLFYFRDGEVLGFTPEGPLAPSAASS